MINQTFHTHRDIASRLALKLHTPSLLTLSHIKDRYGCDAISDEEVLHFPSKSIPDMEIAGGGCHPISLRFHGVPPFTLDYTLSDSSSSFSSSHDSTTSLLDEFTDFSVFLSNPGSYQFKSVSDSYCKRKFTSPTTRSILRTPTAEIEMPKTFFKVCEIEPRYPKDEQFEINLRGKAPFEVALMTPEGATEIVDIMSNKISHPISKPGNYELLKVSDANCRGMVEGSNTKKTVTMDYHPTPTVKVSGGGEICQGESVDIRFEMTGTGPWDVGFSNGKLTHVFESKERVYTHKIVANQMTATSEKSGTYQVTSIVDATCKGLPGSSQADVTIRPLPTARVHGGGVVCQGEETVLKISLTGTPPWSLSISRNTSDHKIALDGVTESEIEVKADEPGFFYIDYIQDQHCKYRRMNAPTPPRHWTQFSHIE